jgi:hypothetical protein
MTNIKIHGGTANHGATPLCHTCRSATVVRGHKQQDEIIQCSVLECRVTFPVTFCTRYAHRNQPSLWEMEDIAWVLRTDPKRSQIGFVRSKDLKTSERHVLREDW